MATKKVLIVDDDKEITKLVRIILQQDGYKTIVAMNGVEALQKYIDEAPDLILLDIAMPGMNGYEVVNQIRARETGDQYTPIVFLTAHGLGYYRPEGFREKIDGYIVKPLSGSKLRQILAPLLNA